MSPPQPSLPPNASGPAAVPLGPRRRREQRTLEAMFRLHCRALHAGRGTLCDGCETELAYALERLAHCTYGEAKPTCKNCPIHCYRPAMKTRIREIMAVAGPRMTWQHPWLAVRHLLDGFAKAPPR